MEMPTNYEDALSRLKAPDAKSKDRANRLITLSQDQGVTLPVEHELARAILAERRVQELENTMNTARENLKYASVACANGLKSVVANYLKNMAKDLKASLSTTGEAKV